jgi:2'-5' RNA ligase
VRLFVAVVPPESAQRAAHAAADAARRPDDDVAWVKRENLHFTLRFLGEIDARAADDATAAAIEAAARHAPFEAALGAAGAFPSARRARVLWLDFARGAQAMAALAGALDEALTARGFAAAERPFSPHLTLGRVREPREDWTARLGSMRVDPGAGAFPVTALAVIESRLARGGSIYAVRHEAPLTGA